MQTVRAQAAPSSGARALAAALAQFDAATDHIALDPGLCVVLRVAQREFTVHFPVKRDDGSVEVFRRRPPGTTLRDRSKHPRGRAGQPRGRCGPDQSDDLPPVARARDGRAVPLPRDARLGGAGTADPDPQGQAG